MPSQNVRARQLPRALSRRAKSGDPASAHRSGHEHRPAGGVEPRSCRTGRGSAGGTPAHSTSTCAAMTGRCTGDRSSSCSCWVHPLAQDLWWCPAGAPEARGDLAGRVITKAECADALRVHPPWTGLGRSNNPGRNGGQPPHQPRSTSTIQSRAPLRSRRPGRPTRWAVMC